LALPLALGSRLELESELRLELGQPPLAKPSPKLLVQARKLARLPFACLALQSKRGEIVAHSDARSLMGEKNVFIFT